MSAEAARELFPQTADRETPHATEAEISLLGACMIDVDAIAKAVDIVDAGMFYRESHRRIFRAMVTLFKAGDATDPTSVLEALRGSGDLDEAGGMAYLAELMDAVATAANVEYHAKIVEARARQRAMIRVGTDIVRIGYDAGDDVNAAVDDAEGLIMGLRGGRSSGSMRWLKEGLYPAFEKIEERQGAEGGITGIGTGLLDLDNMTGGLQKGDLILLAARPSMGKTALALNIVQHAAIEDDRTVGVFSVEMTEEQVIQRLLCSEALVSLSRLLRGQLVDDDFVRLSAAAGHFNTASIWIDDSARSPLEVRAKARRLKADQPDLALLVVDYLQLMDGPGDSEYESVSAISKSMKGLAKELNVPILALSQLSRKPEDRSDKRPQLSDLRSSGALEQDADVVMFIHRPEYYLKEAEAQEQKVAGVAELIVAKQRNGPTGVVELFFRKECTRFESFTPRMG